MAGKKRVRDVPLYVWVRSDELEAIRGRMEEAGIRNMSAYIRKMALNGYILHVDLSPVQELVALQRRCACDERERPRAAPFCSGFWPVWPEANVI